MKNVNNVIQIRIQINATPLVANLINRTVVSITRLVFLYVEIWHAHVH